MGQISIVPDDMKSHALDRLAIKPDQKTVSKHGTHHYLFEVRSGDMSNAFAALAEVSRAGLHATVEMLMRFGARRYRMFGRECATPFEEGKSFDAKAAKRPRGVDVVSLDIASKKRNYDYVNKGGHVTKDMFGDMD